MYAVCFSRGSAGLPVTRSRDGRGGSESVVFVLKVSYNARHPNAWHCQARRGPRTSGRHPRLGEAGRTASWRKATPGVRRVRANIAPPPPPHAPRAHQHHPTPTSPAACTRTPPLPLHELQNHVTEVVQGSKWYEEDGAVGLQYLPVTATVPRAHAPTSRTA